MHTCKFRKIVEAMLKSEEQAKQYCKLFRDLFMYKYKETLNKEDLTKKFITILIAGIYVCVCETPNKAFKPGYDKSTNSIFIFVNNLFDILTYPFTYGKTIYHEAMHAYRYKKHNTKKEYIMSDKQTEEEKTAYYNSDEEFQVYADEMIDHFESVYKQVKKDKPEINKQQFINDQLILYFNKDNFPGSVSTYLEFIKYLTLENKKELERYLRAELNNSLDESTQEDRLAMVEKKLATLIPKDKKLKRYAIGDGVYTYDIVDE